MWMGKLVIMAGLLIVAGSAVAQTMQDTKFIVPFQFQAGNTVLPAGAYEVGSAPLPSSDILVIHGIDRHGPGPQFLTSESWLYSSASQDKTKLVFRCYAGHCFLSQVWMAGYNVGRGGFVSRQERLLARRGPGLRVSIVAAVR